MNNRQFAIDSQEYPAMHHLSPYARCIIDNSTCFLIREDLGKKVAFSFPTNLMALEFEKAIRKGTNAQEIANLFGVRCMEELQIIIHLAQESGVIE